jgi:hypothetical protein
MGPRAVILCEVQLAEARNAQTGLRPGRVGRWRHRRRGGRLQLRECWHGGNWGRRMGKIDLVDGKWGGWGSGGGGSGRRGGQGGGGDSGGRERQRAEPWHPVGQILGHDTRRCGSVLTLQGYGDVGQGLRGGVSGRGLLLLRILGAWHS